MLKDLSQFLIRIIKKVAAGAMAWFVSLFIILIIGTVLQLPNKGESVSTAYSLSAVLIPITIGLILFFRVGRSTASPTGVFSVYTQDELQAFLDAHDLIDEIRTKVVGVTFNNDDGTNRQDILARCCVGDQVYFRHFVYRGSPAYSVTADHGQIGNLPSDLAQTIDQCYDGCILYGTITKISGGADGFYYGCNILIDVFREKQNPTTHETPPKPSSDPQQKTGSSISPQNIVYPNSRKRQNTKESSVDNSFIAESQWYAARGGADLVDED